MIQSDVVKNGLILPKKKYTQNGGNAMNKGDLIATIQGINFYYGGWNENGWHLVFTHNENFHVGDNILSLPTSDDCKRIYRNYYE